MIIYNGGKATLDGGQIVTMGRSAFGILARTSAQVIASSAIDTFGDRAIGIQSGSVGDSAMQMATVNLQDGATIKTAGYTAYGLHAYYYGVINGSVGIQTTGDFGHGAYVEGAGQIILSNASIETAGATAIGLYASDTSPGDPGAIIANTIRISTTGACYYDFGPAFRYCANGARAEMGANIAINNGAVSTTADDTSALYATGTGSVISHVIGQIATSGAGAYGAEADSGGEFVLRQGGIVTSGDNASGVHVSDTASASLQQESVATSGAMAHGVQSQDGGVIQADSVTIRATGAGAAAIYNAGAGAVSAIAFSNSALFAAAGPVLQVYGGAANVTFDASHASSGQNTLIEVSNDNAGAASTLNFKTTNGSAFIGDAIVKNTANTVDIALDHSQWQGSIVADAGNSIDAQLVASQWIGSANTINNVRIDAASTWRVTANSVVSGTVANAGNVAFTAPVGKSDYKTLTTNNYVGQNGALALNADLGKDGSPSDRLVIDGGAATGATRLLVYNTIGAGALTTGDGIKIVGAIHGGATAPGAFTLGSRVAAGAYEYLLFRGGPKAIDAYGDSQIANDWYLRSTLALQPPAPTTPKSDPPSSNPPSLSPTRHSGPAASAATDPPNYRVEAPTDMILPALAHQFGIAVLGTLDDRTGGRYGDPSAGPDADGPAPTSTGSIASSASNRPGANRADEIPDRASAAWARVFGELGAMNPGHSFASFSSSGAAYDWRLGGFQAGQDLYRHTREDGSRDIAGASIGAGRIDGDAYQVYSDAKAGASSLKAYSLGAYWTHYGASGWYADAVVQGALYDQVQGVSVLGQTLNTHGWGLLASLETGQKFSLAPQWSLIPQAQIVYQTVRLNGGQDEFGQIDFGADNAVYGRIGAKLAKAWNFGDDANASILTTSLHANLWRSVGGGVATTFAALDGSNPARLQQTLGGRWGEIGLGAAGQITRSTTVFAAGDYGFGVGASKIASWSGRAGVEHVW